MSELRAAVVGIDGAGKTTVLRLLHEQPAVQVVHAIRAHEDPHSPWAALSRALAGASAAADTVGRAQLKVAALYLQLCLYGPAERHAAGRGRFLLADRHPLIDPLVYLPLFGQLGADEEPGGDVDTWWRLQDPAAAEDVRDWLRQCVPGGDPWTLGAELLRLGTRPPAELLPELSRRFGVELPHRVLLLDLPVREAIQRMRARARGAELHETATFLAATRQRYAAALTWLRATSPGMVVRRVDCSGLGVAEVAAAVRRSLEAAAPA
ncbi:hypothetical protein [Streptomyces boninensis]|uniref:hypothetical protein n=1 Tax=Streptomyces boninensis TaxID=2039455 RepID=UPI003B222D67